MTTAPSAAVAPGIMANLGSSNVFSTFYEHLFFFLHRMRNHVYRSVGCVVRIHGNTRIENLVDNIRN